MTPQEYNTAGYKVSLQTSQDVINHLETLAVTNYIEPLVGTYNSQDAAQKAALMSVTFVALCKDQLFGTRSGGVRKNTAESEKSDLSTIYERAGVIAYANLEKLGDVRLCCDCFTIFFKSNYFSIN